MKVDVEITGLDGVLDMLKALPPEVVSRRGGPVKSALRKGAIVIQKAAKANLQARMGHQVDDEERAATGLLLANVIVSRGKAPASGKGERYVVRVKSRRYPGRQGKAETTTTKNAQRMEYGTSRQTAEPWIRPAVQAKGQEAIGAIERELLAGVDRVVKKLAKGR